MQALADGDWMVGLGRGAATSPNSSPAGQVLFDAHLPAALGVLPRLPAALERAARRRRRRSRVARRRARAATVYASWNGATEVASWRVLAGASASDARARRERAAQAGFETAIALPARRAAGSYVGGAGARALRAPCSAPRAAREGAEASRRSRGGGPPWPERQVADAAFDVRVAAALGGLRGGRAGGREVVGEAARVCGAAGAAGSGSRSSSSKALLVAARAACPRAALSPGAVVQLEAPARACGSRRARLPRPAVSGAIPSSGQLRVGRVLGFGRAHRDDVQRRVGGVGLDRELGDDLVGGVQHVVAPGRCGVGEDRGEVERGRRCASSAARCASRSSRVAIVSSSGATSTLEVSCVRGCLGRAR